MELEVLNEISDKFIKQILDGLDDYNSDYLVSGSEEDLAVVIQHDGVIHGGIIARKKDTWLGIKYLWVSDGMRRQGMGARLLEKLEQHAKNKGCSAALVDTMSFQALPFYLKHGYSIRWTLEDYPRKGYCRHYLSKQL